MGFTRVRVTELARRAKPLLLKRWQDGKEPIRVPSPKRNPEPEDLEENFAVLYETCKWSATKAPGVNCATMVLTTIDAELEGKFFGKSHKQAEEVAKWWTLQVTYGRLLKRASEGSRNIYINLLKQVIVIVKRTKRVKKILGGDGGGGDQGGGGGAGGGDTEKESQEMSNYVS